MNRIHCWLLGFLDIATDLETRKEVEAWADGYHARRRFWLWRRR